jgi:hypothetical protein
MKLNAQNIQNGLKQLQELVNTKFKSQITKMLILFEEEDMLNLYLLQKTLFSSLRKESLKVSFSRFKKTFDEKFPCSQSSKLGNAYLYFIYTPNEGYW